MTSLPLLRKCKTSHFLFKFTKTDYGCSYWKSALPRQGWLYLSVNHLCFYSYFMGAETIIVLRWSSITVSNIKSHIQLHVSTHELIMSLKAQVVYALVLHTHNMLCCGAHTAA